MIPILSNMIKLSTAAENRTN